MSDACQQQATQEGIKGLARRWNTDDASEIARLITAAIDDVVADWILWHGVLPPDYPNGLDRS